MTAYGRDEAITSNCDTSVAFTPNKIQTAQELSKLAGETTVRHAHRTRVAAPARARRSRKLRGR